MTGENLFVGAEYVSTLMSVSIPYAYKLIKKLMKHRAILLFVVRSIKNIFMKKFIERQADRSIH